MFNIVDNEPAPMSTVLPYLAECAVAKPPLRIPAWLGWLAAGEVAVSMMTEVRGSSNARVRREPGWKPRWLSSRQGFRSRLAEGVDADGGR